MKKILLLILILIPFMGSAEPQKFTGDLGPGGLGYIPDNPAPATEFTCAVTGVGVLKKNFFLNITFDITHTYAGDDLTLKLISPTGTVLLLKQANGGTEGLEDFRNTRFTQTATENIIEATAPYNGEWIPQEEEGLAKFNGQNADGTWKLSIIDEGLIAEGTLNSWSLSFDKEAGNVKPVADFNFEQSELIVTFSNTSTNFPTTFAWDFGDGETDSVANPFHTYAQAGTYNVTLVAGNNGGTDTVVKEVTVISSTPTGISENSIDPIQIPNPNNGRFFVDLNQNALISIYNLEGKRLFSKQFQKGKAELNLELNKNGMYFLNVLDSEGKSNSRIFNYFKD